MEKNYTSLMWALLLLFCTTAAHSQAWKAFNILSGTPNGSANEIRFLNGTTGCTGTLITTTNGVPSGNSQLPYGAAFDPTEGKLYYSKPGTAANTSVFNVYNNTGASATNTNIATISGGEFFRMGVGQDGNVYGTINTVVATISLILPHIDIETVKLTRYNPATNTFSILGNIQCPSTYSSTMPPPYNDGNYWSSSDGLLAPLFAGQLGNASYGDLVVAPNNTMYITIGRRLLTIPNYESITGTGPITCTDIGDILPVGVGYNFTTQGPGTYGLSWDFVNNNLLVVSSRNSDGADGSYNADPATANLSGSFRLNCSGSPTAPTFGDLASSFSSIGAAKTIAAVQWMGYGNWYRITYRIRVENIGTSILKNVQMVQDIATDYPSLTVSSVSAAFVSNPANLVLNGSYNGTTNSNLLSGTRTLYGALYKGADLNGGGGNVTAGSNFAVIDVTFDVSGVATNGTTTYSGTASATATAFDATTITDISDNGTTVESGTANMKADDANEGDATSIKFGSSISGTVWNDVNGSAANTFTNIFTTGEGGNNAGGLHAILIDPVTNQVLASTAVAANGTYSFSNVPSFSNLQVRLSTTAGSVGAAPPAQSAPTGWGFTSPGTTNSTGDINTGTFNAADAVRFGAVDDTNNDFGIEQLPESAVNVQVGQLNPGGLISVSVPASAFQTSNVGLNPNTQDYSGGTVNNIRITSFPTNANSITINGTVYINGGTCPGSCTTWPVGGVIVPYTNGVGVAQPIEVDPVNGFVDVAISFVAIDNANLEDLTPGSVTVSFASVLPLGKLEASAVLNGTVATVNWQTVNEMNTAKFVVERSLTGNSDFLPIGERTAAGNNAGTSNYAFTDDIPALMSSNQVVYYRIRAVDVNGRIAYSNVVAVRMAKGQLVKVWPNPYTDKVNIAINSNINTTVQVRIMAQDGKTLQVNNFALARGNNQLSLAPQTLTPGVYLIEIVSAEGGIRIVQKLIKA